MFIFYLAISDWWCFCENIFKKGQKHQTEAEGKKKVGNSNANTKVREEGRGGVSPNARADIPLQPLEETMPKHISTLQHTEDPIREQLDVSCRNCDLWRNHTEADFFLKDCRSHA